MPPTHSTCTHTLLTRTHPHSDRALRADDDRADSAGPAAARADDGSGHPPRGGTELVAYHAGERAEVPETLRRATVAGHGRLAEGHGRLMDGAYEAKGEGKALSAEFDLVTAGDSAVELDNYRIVDAADSRTYAKLVEDADSRVTMGSARLGSGGSLVSRVCWSPSERWRSRIWSWASRRRSSSVFLFSHSFFSSNWNLVLPPSSLILLHARTHTFTPTRTLARTQYNPRPHTLPSLERLLAACARSGRPSRRRGMPPQLGPFVVGLTGTGQVAQGCLSMPAELPIEMVRVEDLDALMRRGVDLRKTYLVHAKPEDYLVRVDGAKYDRAHCYQSPQSYTSVFCDRVAPYLTLFLNGTGWSPSFPRLMKTKQLEVALSRAQGFGGARFTNIGDISCDVEGGLEFHGKTRSKVCTTNSLLTRIYSLFPFIFLRAAKKGLLFLTEIGLDSGINHCSALELLDKFKRQGKHVLLFISFCGGLPLPENAHVPLGHRFSWRPQGVLTAALNGAAYLLGKQVRYVLVPGDRLLQSYWPGVPITSQFKLEGLPNRDSPAYKKHCQIYTHDVDNKARTIVRGTLSALMSSFAALGFLNTMHRMHLTAWPDFVEQRLRIKREQGHDTCRGSWDGAESLGKG
ncbi:hypothetical protein CVT25_004805 [Psilocybe cyanescens]|uniref:Saccharopine dehydrogenase-like C-terminal domain-containing protein n=1 Tax=Psilocybe cyanescens TaxID=93625 RepID=A0A409XGK2_PSICY|nr:hypothetical protein CVT25_004805 [Psilocybe cyanescens]